MNRRLSSTLPLGPPGRSAALALVVSLLASTIALVFASKAWSQSPSHSTVDLSAGTALAPPNLDEATLDLRWRAFRAAEPESLEEDEAFASVLDAQRELGIPNLPNQALVLLRDAVQSRDSKRAAHLIQWARALSPRSTDPDLVRATMMWQSEPWAIPQLVGALAGAYDRALDQPVEASRVRLNQGRVLLWVWLAVLAVFLGIQAVRYLRLVSHDLDSLTSRVLGLRLSRALVALALLIPAVLLLSPLAVALVLGVLFWPYQRPMEKLATVVLLALAAAAPLLVDHLGELTTFDQERAEALHHAQYERCGARCRARLDALVALDADDGQARFSKALVLFRRGTPADLDAAQSLLSAYELDPQWTEVAILEGNLLAAQGDLEAARQTLDAAAEQATYGPHVLAANLNLNQIYRSLGDPERARACLDRASDIDYDYALDFVELSELRVNRWLVSVGAPPSRLGPSSHGSPPAEATLAADRVWRAVGGRLPRRLVLPALIVVAAIFGAGLLVRRRLRSCAGCPTCGQVITTRDEPVAAEAGYCADCYDLFVMGASLTSSVRREYELRVENHGRRQKRARTWGNLLGPGIGYLLDGAALAGLPLVTLAIAGCVVLLAQPPAGDLTHLATGSTFDGRVLLGALLLVLAYVIAWLAVGIGHRRGRGQSRRRREEVASDEA